MHDTKTNPLDMIDSKAIADMIGVSRRQVVDRISKDPTFPPPAIELSPKTRRWSRAAVVAWLTAGRRSARPTRGSTSAGVAADPGAR